LKNKPKPVAVIGLGNILMRDEGIGIHALDTMRKRYCFSGDVELIEGGTPGLDLLSELEDREKVLILDAAHFGKEPGFVGMLEDEDIPSFLTDKPSAHDIGLADLLFAARLKDIIPDKLVFIGIEPEAVEVGLDVTDSARYGLEKVVSASIDLLRRWRIECIPKM